MLTIHLLSLRHIWHGREPIPWLRHGLTTRAFTSRCSWVFHDSSHKLVRYSTRQTKMTTRCSQGHLVTSDSTWFFNLVILKTTSQICWTQTSQNSSKILRNVQNEMDQRLEPHLIIMIGTRISSDHTPNLGKGKLKSQFQVEDHKQSRQYTRNKSNKTHVTNSSLIT